MPLKTALIALIMYALLALIASVLLMIIFMMIEVTFKKARKQSSIYPTARDLLEVPLESAINKFIINSPKYSRFGFRLFLYGLMPIVIMLLFAKYFAPLYLNGQKALIVCFICCIIYLYIGFKVYRYFIITNYTRILSLHSVARTFIVNAFCYIALSGSLLLCIYCFSPLHPIIVNAALFSFLSFFIGSLAAHIRDILINRQTLYQERILEAAFHEAKINAEYLCNKNEKIILQHILNRIIKGNYFLSYFQGQILFAFYDLLVFCGIWQKSREYYKLKCKYYYYISNPKRMDECLKYGQLIISRFNQRESQTLLAMQSMYHLNNGSYIEASNVLRKALHNWPENPYLWLELSKVYWHADDLDKATECADNVLQIAPTCPMAKGYRAKFNCERLINQYRENDLSLLRIQLSEVSKQLNDAHSSWQTLQYRWPPPILTSSWGLIKLIEGNYEEAMSCLYYGAFAHSRRSHIDSLYLLGLAYLIGDITQRYMRSEFFFSKIMYSMKGERSNKYVKLANKNLKMRINAARPQIVFNENIIYYPFLRDPDIPEAAIANKADSERLIGIRKELLLKNSQSFVKYVDTSIQPPDLQVRMQNNECHPS